MKTIRRLVVWFTIALQAAAQPLPHTAPLDAATGDERSKMMVAGIDRFAMREIEESTKKRETFWRRDVSSPQAYAASVEPNRERLREMLGICPEDKRASVIALEFLSTTEHDSKLAEADNYTIHAVRWPVMEGVYGEGIYFKQREKAKARVILLPHTDLTPEQLAGLVKGQEAPGHCAHELALAGCDVIIPALVNTRSEFSGSAAFNVQTNIPHREWLYRQSFELGRHVIGYDLQSVSALVDWMKHASEVPVGIAGYGEGGWLALCAAAVDQRIDATLICGAFENRNKVWSQPIYRNVFGLLREFGDAEMASLVLPRSLVITYGKYPEAPPLAAARPGMRANAAPGALAQPEIDEVRHEVQRARKLTQGRFDNALRLVVAEDDDASPFTANATEWFRKELKLTAIAAPSALRFSRAPLPDDSARQQRLVSELERFTQRLLPACDQERATRFWKKLPLTELSKYTAVTESFREEFWNEAIGRLPDPSVPMNPRIRLIAENDAFTTHEVMLDVWPDVTAWGYLLVPKHIKRGEKRPVVVCQHGLEGLPEDVVTENKKDKAFGYYKGFASKLAREGFITFAPHNFYRGHDDFRVIQRKLNLTGRTLFSVIIGQHQRILEWLKTQPEVDAKRIAFYGLSYGGKSAMRIPAVLTDYCLSICSGDFNEWVRKCVSTDMPMSYVFTPEYEMWEWNLGRTFNYAEMAALIAPRPFMVERGHNDGVGTDEWVSFEYAKVRRLYDKLGIGDRTQIEYFDGPHTINGKGTFEFLRKQLNGEPVSR